MKKIILTEREAKSWLKHWFLAARKDAEEYLTAEAKAEEKPAYNAVLAIVKEHFENWRKPA
jgi:hypothetical protein